MSPVSTRLTYTLTLPRRVSAAAAAAALVPIRHRIAYELCMLIFHVNAPSSSLQAPAYLKSLVVPSSVVVFGTTIINQQQWRTQWFWVFNPPPPNRMIGHNYVGGVGCLCIVQCSLSDCGNTVFSRQRILYC